MGGMGWIEEWHREGCALLPEFLPGDEMLKVQDDFAAVFGPPGQHLGSDGPPERSEAFDPEQAVLSEVSPAIGVHTGPGTIGVTWMTGR